MNRSATDDSGLLPPHEALRRRLDAALGVTARLSHRASDTLQNAVDTVCGNGLAREWADLFVTMAANTDRDTDRPERVLDLARAVRALLDRVRNEPWQATVRELCGDAATDPPAAAVRRIHQWTDRPDARPVLEAFAEYDGRCRRSRTSAAEVRRAVAELVMGGEGEVPGRLLAEVVKTAGAANVPPAELALEVRALAELPPDAFGPDAPAGLIQLFRDRGYSVSHLVELYREHAATAESVAILTEWLPALLENELTEGSLPGLLVRGKLRPPAKAAAPGRLSPRAWDDLLRIVRAVQPLGRPDEALALVFGQFATPADLERSVRPLRELVQACLARPGAGLKSLQAAVRQFRARPDGHAATLAMAGLPGRMTDREASVFFVHYLADHPPHAEGTADARRYREKTYDVIRRLHNVSYGFTALKVVNQRMPDGGPSAYDECGDDLFAKLFVVHMSAHDQFPGYGVLFEGPQVERIFVHDPGHPTDPLHRYRAAWTDPNRLRSTHLDLDRFADAEFAFVRGFIGVSVPEGDHAPQYEVAGVPLTLMVWNQHFPGVDGELAMLVPTALYRERLRPCLIRCKELGRPHPEVRDACRAGLDPHSLREECAARSLPYVDLGSPSVAGGGLVNGFPAGKPPFHAWEAELPKHETRDGAGHVHKSHRLGGYRTRLGSDPELDAALQPLRDANDLVFDIVSSYLNLLDIFFICFATWHRGDTLDAIDFEDVYDEDEQQQIAEAEDGDEPFNRRNVRILETAYAVHDQLAERNAPAAEYRVYCSANPLHLYPPPEAAVTLDTHDMKLVVKGPGGRREFDLSRDRVGSRERAEMIWVTHALAYMRRTGFDLRPYDRAAVADQLGG